MRTYIICLYHGTDLRDYKEVEALDEIRALASFLLKENWVVDKGFKITIELKVQYLPVEV